MADPVAPTAEAHGGEVHGGDARAALARLASNVAVITAYGEGRPHGLTANAWGEAHDPPMVLVTLGRGSRSLPLVLAAGTFAVNVLGADQAELARRFARREREAGERFAGLTHHPVRGAPVLEGCVARLVARVADTVAFGAHEIVTGHVLWSDRGGAGAPLLFYDNAFGRFTTTARTAWRAGAENEDV
ncbi:flavin reductase family protein [Streptomyces sp. 4N509B]|uniref:flavin reductase family protein n=1 Tax=Streptomyces sp. 4N509B TaxID=3457413 RepID=UPI003FD3D40B